MAIISIHNGRNVHRDYNIRNQQVIEKENGPYEIWIDEKVKDAYHRLFDASQERYNASQEREERKIRDYYTQVKNYKTQPTCYEMIVSIYDKETSAETKKEIYKEFIENWKNVNPNLELIGVYYHCHEDAENPHIHIDYIPIAHNCTIGIDTQVGLEKALGEMGFTKEGKITVQIKWEKYMDNMLKNLCEIKGIKVEPTSKKHLEIQFYKLPQQSEVSEDNIDLDL